MTSLTQKADTQTQPPSTRRRRAQLVMMGLVVLLVVAILLGLGLGAVRVTPAQIGVILLDRLEIGHDFVVEYEQRENGVLYTIRLPRVLLGILVGAALGISGAAIQGLFRNPLAAPGLIGISSGAALAAVSVIVLGATLLEGLSELLGNFTLPVAAFLGGVATTFLIYQLASRNGRTSVMTMLLAGIAINAVTGAVIGILTFIADDEQLRSITFWGLGSLGGATWRSLQVAGPMILVALLLLPLLARPLNALLLGETEATHLGINVERTKRLIVLWVALAVGAAVAVTGAIGFVGLVVPHLLRLTLGPDHRYVLPGSALLGASLLLGADLIARTIVVPAELPIGIVTALLGAPFFLWLLLKDRQRYVI
ncbi:MAG: iron chelate uptake ABC transporter family permease subunit [Chloroflexota bacterium]